MQPHTSRTEASKPRRSGGCCLRFCRRFGGHELLSLGCQRCCSECVAQLHPFRCSRIGLHLRLQLGFGFSLPLRLQLCRHFGRCCLSCIACQRTTNIGRPSSESRRHLGGMALLLRLFRLALGDSIGRDTLSLRRHVHRTHGSERPQRRWLAVRDALAEQSQEERILFRLYPTRPQVRDLRREVGRERRRLGIQEVWQRRRGARW